MRRARQSLQPALWGRMKRALLLPLLGAVACVPPYRPPTADQPHAVVKLRRSYEMTAGTLLAEAVDIDEHSALRENAASGLVRGARTDAILVHPVPSTFVFESAFSHTEARLVQESYQVSHTVYRMETYDCSSGFGSSKSYRTCSRSVPHTDYETRYRHVWRQVTVTDAACDAGYRFWPRQGRVYLLQYTFSAHAACSLSCFEQVPEEGGAFKNVPCPAAPPEKD